MVNILLFFILMIILNSLIFINLQHPLTLGLFLMFQTLLTALFSGMLTKTFWFSYSLFLIFMGGMLVLIMYMTSLAYNELFFVLMNFKKKMLFFFFIFFFLLIYLIKMPMMSNLMSFSNLENQNILILKMINKENSMIVNKMFNFPTNLIMILLVTFMFLTLIMSVKITNIFKGPVRSKQ